MAITLDELGDILRNEKQWRDIGGVKENTRAATIMKIVYALVKEPLTKEGIHRATGVHKGAVLTAALEVAIRKNLVFEHKPSIRYRSVDDPLKTKAYGYTYYLLNWSHSDAENFFAVYRDHRGYEQGDWSGYYYSEHLRHEEIWGKIRLGKEMDRGLLESEAEQKERLQKLATFDPKTFDQIGEDAITLIRKRKEAFLREYPGANPSAVDNMTKHIVLDTFIHFKIQEIIPKNRYPDDRVCYTYVDVWERLEKEGLLDFLAKE